MSGTVVQRLSEAHASQVARHLLRLAEPDRRLRFGVPMRDSTIEAYARGIDFAHDRVFGIVGADLELLGVAHLALDPTGQTAELGLSVDRETRGKGYGYALLQRAVAKPMDGSSLASARKRERSRKRSKTSSRSWTRFSGSNTPGWGKRSARAPSSRPERSC
jgi:GNAT superfamily N-acetyltransferase